VEETPLAREETWTAVQVVQASASRVTCRNLEAKDRETVTRKEECVGTVTLTYLLLEKEVESVIFPLRRIGCCVHGGE
jgi:hypothetical protein